jgi:uncharacterized RDD family membrane protein YckC
MSVLRPIQTLHVTNWRKEADAVVVSAGKPALWRRGLAELIDRMLPLPWLAFFFPKWIVIVFLYHLLCDAGTERRSLGKWICRLRVIAAETGGKPALSQAIARRVGSAASQAAWCVWQWMWVALIYEIVALVCVSLSPAGQRLEDWMVGTRVVTERAYRRMKRLKNKG